MTPADADEEQRVSSVPAHRCRPGRIPSRGAETETEESSAEAAADTTGGDDSELEEGPLPGGDKEASAGNTNVSSGVACVAGFTSGGGVVSWRPESPSPDGTPSVLSLTRDSGPAVPSRGGRVSSGLSTFNPAGATRMELDSVEEEDDFGASLCKVSPPIQATRMLMGKKCHCHGYWGKFRFCGVQEPARELPSDRNALWREMDTVSRHSAGLGSFRLFQLIMRHGPCLIRHSPRCDLLLGRFYFKANWARESRTPLCYASELCDESVRRFVLRHMEDLPKLAEETARFVELAGCWGLYAAILCLDKVCRQLHGQDESPGGVFLRIAVALTAAIENSRHSRIYRFHLDARFEGEVLDSVLKRCRDGQLSLSTFTMSTVGFDRVPQYDFLISADPFSRDASWAAMCKWMSTLSCGVSVSVNVTRLNADVNSVIRCLGGYCDLIREKEVHRPVVRVFVDMWDVAAIRVINFILKESTSELTGVCYAFNVPSVLMKRYRAREQRYSLFGRPVSRRLSDLGQESAFEKEYSRCEQSCPKVVVNTDDFLKKMLLCALKGRASVVFVHHVVKYSIMADSVCLPPCLSPDMASCHFGECDMPVQRLTVNVARCVFARSDEQKLHLPDVVLGNTRRYFDLSVLRELVTEAVVWGNARLDALMSASEWWVESALEKLRPLHIGVAGLHTALMRLGFTYFASWDLIERIFEHMYFAAVRASVDLCKSGLPRCEWFERTIYQEGKFIFELYRLPRLSIASARWEALRADMLEFGLRNCQFLAVGPDDEVAHLWGVTPSVWASRGTVFEEETVWSLCPPNRECYFPTVVRRPLRVPVVNYAWLEQHQEEGKATQCLFQAAPAIQNDVEMAAVNLSVFVDQCVALVFYYDSGMTPDVLLARMLKWYHWRFKVGVYKYCAS
ncbi:ribonucleotide reductase subunit 1 [Human betaherpesvirus 5]|uniref:Ribonucleoside-diphosphate reductase large subunit-like protein n=1 Tax=Human cytomegalovirus TaxID=10359 RepID=A0A0G2UBS2_HCMV|nr:ribonucleotide reductase subunit 1 [Human betaherpesvirus 5]AQN73877.1 ribonucleotide reductase subunit 1 [Human betaherpesvirus 5]